jgi:hypothetical protein
MMWCAITAAEGQVASTLEGDGLPPVIMYGALVSWDIATRVFNN